MERTRHVDIDKLSNEELLKLEKAISKKISTIINKATEDANKILNIYGMELNMVIELKEKE